MWILPYQKHYEKSSRNVDSFYLSFLAKMAPMNEKMVFYQGLCNTFQLTGASLTIKNNLNENTELLTYKENLRNIKFVKLMPA